jgi:hypothetical protein
LGSWCTCQSIVRWLLTLYAARMVVGSKAEEELFSMTRGEVGKELLKMPGHTDFRRFNTHLVKTAAEWPAMLTKLKSSVDAWDKDKRECPALALILLPCSPVLCLQPSSTLTPTCGKRAGCSLFTSEVGPHTAWLPCTMCVQPCSGPGLQQGLGRCSMVF